MSKKLFFITGVSSGLGQAIATVALEAGHRVVGTVRKEKDAELFRSLKQGNSFAKVLDVTNDDDVFRVVSEIESEIGEIDILINNAGYGHEGIIEESPMIELRRQFDVNVFGAVAVIKAVLPFMRKRRSGHIINVTSMGGLMTIPGVGFYHGSKFALEGISGTLAKEVRDFGIFVTALEPGSFRTDWAGRSMIRTERSIADYDSLMNPVRKAREDKSGKQLGNPIKAGEAILKLISSPNPPTHLMLGADALAFVSKARDEHTREIQEWETVTKSTDFTE